jgi:hypothetical protein
MEQHLHIEVWTANRIYFNSFIGYESLELISIASGSVQRLVNIYESSDKAGAEGVLKCSISLKVIFEEIWDFYL